MYSDAPRSVLKEKGARAIPLVWLDAHSLKPDVRSGICVQECKKGANATVSLSEKLFSPLPPLEALKISMSLKTSRNVSRTEHVPLIAHFDMSRAPRAEEVFAELSMGDAMKTKDYVALVEVHVWNSRRKQLVPEGSHRSVGRVWVCRTSIEADGAW